MHNPQETEFKLVIGAKGYRSRSDITATDPHYLVSGSQNMLVNEATDKDGDKVETRAGYELFGAASEDRNKIKSEFVFKTKVGDVVMGRMDDNGDLEYYSEESNAWETLLTGLNGSYPLNWTTVWNGTELLRILLFVNHSNNIYEWTGATGTYASSAAGPNTITINETIATRGFFATGASNDTIRVKDSGGTWRTFTVSSHSGSVFTVSEDPTAFTFTAGAIVVQAVRVNTTEPASGVINDVIKTLQNHVYVGSNASSVVYMSKSTDYLDFGFSSPRIPTEGWQFVLDEFCIGFETNIAANGEESMVMFAGDDWIYRVEFVQLGDTSVVETAKIKPIIVSSGQGAVEQGLISKVKNSIIFINRYNELVELGIFENQQSIAQIPLSDPIKPDFLAATFTGGQIRFWRNNLYVTAPTSSRMFILSFREDDLGSRRFWQPPQILPIGRMSDYNSNLIGHSAAITESYTLFVGTNDNGKPIAFKAHFAYNNYGFRDKLKNFELYFSELYMSSNVETLTHKLVYEYLGAKTIQEFIYKGSETSFIFQPNPSASLGVNSLGTSSLGSTIDTPTEFLKYRRFKPVVGTDFFEIQTRYECDDLDAQFRILCHGPNAVISKNSPTILVK